uniref:Uncharacterized protein n=1 Tax=Arundo donax TaxID=35708 RepID=A0A0A8ZC91_ARUDO
MARAGSPVVVTVGRGGQGHNDGERLRGFGGEGALPREDGAEGSAGPRGAGGGSEKHRRHLVCSAVFR